jgi:hypothetical protein
MFQPNLRPAKSPGSSRLAGTFAAALGFLAAALLAPGAAQAATFAVSGTTLAINLTEANESVAVTSAGSTYAFELTGGTWSGTDGGGATGDGTATLTATAASFTAVTVDDGSTDNAVTFNTSGANIYTSAFTVTLDDATAGTITFNGNTAFAGSSALSASTSRNIDVVSGAVVSVVNGNLTMSANQQVTPTAGVFRGIDVNGGTVTTSGTGAIALSGKGGDGGSSNHGINLRAGGKVTSTASGAGAGTITFNGTGRGTSSNSGVEVAGAGSSVASVSGNIQITGTSLGTEDGNTGFYLNTAATVTSTGTGTTAANITINATAGNGTSNNAGFTMFGLSTANGISAVDGDISITGQGRGQGTLADGIRVQDRSFIRTTGDGNISLTGTASSDGGVGPGIWVTNAGGSGAFIEALGTGSVTLTGTGSGTGSENTDIYVNGSTLGNATSAAAITINADTLTLDATSNLLGNASGSFTLQPRTAGRDILLGADDTESAFGLTAAELARITVGNLTVGSATANSITVSAAITLPATTSLNLLATTITVGSNPVTAGSVSLNGVGQPVIAIEQPAGTAIDSSVTRSFGNVVFGGTADLVITVRNTGSGDLEGLTITGLSGTDFSAITSPTAPLAPGESTTFTIRFAPTSSGLKSAALTLNSNALGVPSFVINLVGGGAAASLAGTRSVGPTGDYASLTAAISAIQAYNGPTGPLVLELQPAYVSTVETFPLVFSNLGTTAANTLTIRPQAGATALSISSADTTAATVDLNGAQFVTFDGRPGGVGTVKQLTIENTAGGRAVELINDASNNTIRYALLNAVPDAGGWGIVSFRTTAGTNGNDNNTIEYCDIGNEASTTSYGIISLGSDGTISQYNSGNTVSNCNIFNFSASGARLSSGNTDWTISGNSFYQTANRAAVDGIVNAINILNASGNNFTVTGNFIGGSAPNCGGTAWTTTGTSAAYQFQGIALNVGTTTASSVQGNTIANMVWTSRIATTSMPGVWCGIYVQEGSVIIGTVTGNTIGSGTGTGSISVTTAGSGGTSFGIVAAGTGTGIIANNTIGSITVNGTDTTISASLTGIQVTSGANTISNNTVGSTTTANSLSAATSSTSSTGQQVTGILRSSSGDASITGNTVANLNNNYNGTANTGHIRGISTSAGGNTITGNTVRNLSTTSRNANANVAQSVYGINAGSTTAGQTVSQNTVHSLANTAAAANVSVTGMFIRGSSSDSTVVIARNFVHSLAVSSTGANSALNGMQFLGGSFTAQNNLVRVGLDASGSSTAVASIVRGIFDNGSTAGRNFYHNSVYVGGTQTSGNANSRAFDGTSGVSNTRTYQNNVFVNARSNSGGTGKHYAVQYGGTGVNPAGLTAGGNLFLASGTGGLLGIYNGADLTDLASWQAATGQDATSLSADPLYLNPTGTAATVDLHLPSSSPANNAGLALAAVTDDFDGNLRSLTTPDIGADEIGVAANVAPVAGADGLNRPNTTRVAKVLKATLLANDSDADSDTLTLTAVGNALPAGATVAIAGNFVFYTAPANNAGNGSFTYTLSAGTHTVTGTVTVTETTTSGGGGPGNPNALAIVPSGANFAVTFVGVPGGSYRVQYTTSSGQPYTWNEFDPPAVITAAANGVIPHTDVNPPDPMRLYRAVSHP